jgi:hypothetical protein
MIQTGTFWQGQKLPVNKNDNNSYLAQTIKSLHFPYPWIMLLYSDHPNTVQSSFEWPICVLKCNGLVFEWLGQALTILYLISLRVKKFI